MNKLRVCLTSFARLNSVNYGGCREFKRWVSPTLKEICRRKKQLPPPPEPKRNTFFEWNRDAEIYAFNERLKEKFDIEKLNQAFIHRSYIEQELKKQAEMGIEEPKLDIEDNEELIKTGEEVTSQVLMRYFNMVLPNLPEEGVMALHDHLMSQKMLATASIHVGTKDIILTAEHPVEEETLARTFLALVGALTESVNIKHATKFVQDFLIAGLADKDLNEIWSPPKPFEMLNNLILEQTKASIEARIIGQAGSSTILSAYQIGIFLNQECIGSGCGQTIEEAKNVAAATVLSNMFGISESSQPLDFY